MWVNAELNQIAQDPCSSKFGSTRSLHSRPEIIVVITIHTHITTVMLMHAHTTRRAHLRAHTDSLCIEGLEKSHDTT